MPQPDPYFIATAADMANSFEEAAEKLLEAFMFVDKNRDAFIQLNELRPLLTSLGLELDDDGVKKIIDLFDDNGDGEMDFLEFIEFFSYMAKMIIKRNPKCKYMDYMNEKKE